MAFIAFRASTTFTASTTFRTTNSHRLIKQHLKSHPLSNHRQDLDRKTRSNQWQDSGFYPAITTSSFFRNHSDICDLTPSTIKSFVTDNFLCCRHHYYVGVQNSMSTARNLCKYIQRVIIYMVMTKKGHLGPNIQLQTHQ